MKILLIALVFSLGASLSPTISQDTDPPKYVDFKLLNKTAKSIPLIIPGVMNPNLSPFSSSGVDLKVGQEILFKYKGKRRVLLVVTEDLDGTKVIVNTLRKQRQMEIDQK